MTGKESKASANVAFTSHFILLVLFLEVEFWVSTRKTLTEKKPETISYIILSNIVSLYIMNDTLRKHGEYQGTF